MRKTILIVLTISWMLVIFLLSNMTGKTSTSTSKKIISSGVEKVIIIVTHKKPSEKEVRRITNKLNYPLRKMMHSTVYLVLTLLVLNTLIKFKFKSKKLYLTTFLISYLYACTDEFHQLFVKRNGSIIDTLIDSIGIFIILYCYHIYENKKLKRQQM